MDKGIIYLLLIVGAILLVWFLFRKNFKFLKVPSVCLITGGVKTGKSLLSCNLSTKDYIKIHRKWWFATHLFKKELEEPLYYTNCYISFGWLHRKLNKNIVIIDLDYLYRNCRFNYKSVIYIQECSLFSDNMDYNNQNKNVDLSLFNKLIAHETRGGKLYYDTQSILDSHYSIKRVCSTYFFIQKNYNFLLFHILYVREMVNQENGVNSFIDDVDTTTRKVFIPFWYHKRYDRYEFSYLTDDLNTGKRDNQLRNGLISFNELYIKKSDKRKKGDDKK